MKKTIVLLMLLGLFTTGCATREYVAKQIEPVQKKVNTVEDGIATLNKRIDSMTQKLDSLDSNGTALEGISRK